MSVISVNEHSASGSVDELGHRTWTVLYKVRTNDKTDGALVAIAANGIPGILESYTFGNEQDSWAYRRGIDAQLAETGKTWKLWDVTVVFSTRPVRQQPDDKQGKDPADYPPEISGSFIRQQVPLEKDKDGNPATNAAGDLFLGLQKQESTSSLVIRNTYTPAQWDLDEITNNGDSVNSVAFFGKTVNKWLFTAFTWRQFWWGNVPRYEAQFTFETKINGDSWLFQPANRGPRFKVTAGGTEFNTFRTDDGYEYGDGLGELNADGTRRLSTASPKVIFYDGLNGLDPIEAYPAIDFATKFTLPSALPGV